MIGLAFLVFLPQESTNVSNVVFFLLATLLTEAYQISLPTLKGSISIGFVTTFATVISQGFWPGIFVAVFGTVSPLDFSGNTPLGAVLYNRLQLGMAAGVSALVFDSLSGGRSIVSGPALGAFIISSLVYFLVNGAFFVAYLTTLSSKRMPLRRALHELKTPLVVNYLALFPLAYLIAVIFNFVGVLGVTLFLLPLMAARFSFQRYVDVYHMFVGTIRALAVALEAKDRYTYGHADRVARLSVEIGKRLGMNDHELEILQYAAILHDIGKIGIRDEVLNKAGRYTHEEFEEMKRHPVIGARIVASVKALEQGADWI
ncbi:MAG TPA: HD domain-containing phosphohydrolase, partial [Thermaerobacter sp.]